MVPHDESDWPRRHAVPSQQPGQSSGPHVGWQFPPPPSCGTHVMRLWMGPQPWHSWPPYPHASAEMPSEQWFASKQQPVQFDGPQSGWGWEQTPLKHEPFGPQDSHALPANPHMSAVSTPRPMHTSLRQHPKHLLSQPGGGGASGGAPGESKPKTGESSSDPSSEETSSGVGLSAEASSVSYGGSNKSLRPQAAMESHTVVVRPRARRRDGARDHTQGKWPRSGRSVNAHHRGAPSRLTRPVLTRGPSSD